MARKVTAIEGIPGLGEVNQNVLVWFAIMGVVGYIFASTMRLKGGRIAQ